MDVLLYACLILSIALVTLFIFTQVYSRKIAKSCPPVGCFYDIEGTKLHAVFSKTEASSKNPTLIFIHGASGNLQDQLAPFFPSLKDEFDLLFVDRPGHGWSERGATDNRHPDKQAELISKLMEKVGIDDAILVGHSFGCSVALSFARLFHKKTIALLLLAPVAYPWPGGIAWFYHLASWPYLGWLFTNTLVLPFGLSRLNDATSNVFLPNPMPENYSQDTKPQLVLRPPSFRANARDIENLAEHVTAAWPKYETIQTPTIIISGDQDNVVFPYIHAKGLAWHIKSSELIELKNLGHKPDHSVTELAVSAVQKLAGNHGNDLRKMAQQLDKELLRHIHTIK